MGITQISKRAHHGIRKAIVTERFTIELVNIPIKIRPTLPGFAYVQSNQAVVWKRNRGYQVLRDMKSERNGCVNIIEPGMGEHLKPDILQNVRARLEIGYDDKKILFH